MTEQPKTAVDLAEECLNELRKRDRLITALEEQIYRAHLAMIDGMHDQDAVAKYLDQYNEWKREHD